MVRDAIPEPGAMTPSARPAADPAPVPDVSHEFNNLLAKIIGLAEMAMDHVADRPEALAELETLITVAEQGAELVARLDGGAAPAPGL